MKACHISDIHLDERGMFVPMIDVVSRSIRDAAERGAALYIFAGDLVGRESMHSWSRRERMAWIQLAHEASEHGPVCLIGGNHDQPGELGVLTRIMPNKHPIYAFGESSGSVELDDLVVTCIPYRTSLEGEPPTIAPTAKPQITVMHQPVRGVTVGGFEIASFHDWEPDDAWLAAQPVKYFAFGHIHAQQQIAPNAWYSGSPAPLNFSETGDKGYLLVDLGGDVAQVEPRTIESWKMSTVTATMDEGRVTLQATSTDVKNAHVRIVMNVPTGQEVSEAERQRIRDTLIERGALSVRIKTERERTVIVRESAIPQAANDEAKLIAALAERQVTDDSQRHILERFKEVKGAE